MIFNPIAIDNWSRKPYFEHYLKHSEFRTCFDSDGRIGNTFPISSIPWVSFTGFNLNVYNEGTYLLPIFTMGKYFQHDEKILLPLSGQFHHAVCDGYHAGVLYNELQLRADTCREWLQTIN